MRIGTGGAQQLLNLGCYSKEQEAKMLKILEENASNLVGKVLSVIETTRHKDTWTIGTILGIKDTMYGLLFLVGTKKGPELIRISPQPAEAYNGTYHRSIAVFDSGAPEIQHRTDFDPSYCGG